MPIAYMLYNSSWIIFVGNQTLQFEFFYRHYRGVQSNYYIIGSEMGV